MMRIAFCREPDDGDQNDNEIDVFDSPCSHAIATEPTTPSGTTSIAAKGIDQLS
jgi:hypothetical protein